MTLHKMMQDTLRGSALNRIPLINKKAVINILDCLPDLGTDARVAGKFLSWSFSVLQS